MAHAHYESGQFLSLRMHSVNVSCIKEERQGVCFPMLSILQELMLYMYMCVYLECELCLHTKVGKRIKLKRIKLYMIKRIKLYMYAENRHLVSLCILPILIYNYAHWEYM